MTKTAIVIGATGVTGKEITRYLLLSDHYEQVLVFSRKKLILQHEKLINHVVDFDHIEQWSALVKGDDLFSAMGTTRKQAGSQSKQYTVDFSYQANVMATA
jgi:N-acetyl-gamma-glutamylphosphate reductase